MTLAQQNRTSSVPGAAGPHPRLESQQSDPTGGSGVGGMDASATNDKAGGGTKLTQRLFPRRLRLVTRTTSGTTRRHQTADPPKVLL